jgi:enamine deaminase RidA (YjgF/YER057c/UK114 family)
MTAASPGTTAGIAKGDSLVPRIDVAEFFATPPPRTTVETTGLLVPGCLVEIDLIAAMP